MKVLIVRVGALGDVLHALPAVAKLRALRPEWQIDWVVDPRWAPLLVDGKGNGPIVSGVHLADTRLWSRAPVSLTTLRSLRVLRRQLQAEQYEVAVDMQGTLRSAVVTRMSGASVRAGYSDPREPQAAWFYTRKCARRARHVVEQASELLQQTFDLPLSSGSYELPGVPFAAVSSPHGGFSAAAALTPLPDEPWADDWAALEAASGRLCLLSPGAGWGAKQWPAVRFGALARQLRAAGFDVAVTAPRTDDQIALSVIAESGPPGDQAARLLVSNVAGLVAITRRAALMVGGDSGPTHLAAALRIPLVALFGPTDPARNGPFGPGPMRVLRDPASVTSYKHVDLEDPGLARISVEQVTRAALDVSAVP